MRDCSRCSITKFIANTVNTLFSWKFGVDLKEAAQQVSEYSSFNEFFTRKLLPDSRTIDPDQEAVLSPVDGILGESGKINKGRLIQAKGLDYRLADLLKDPERTRHYDGGIFHHHLFSSS